MATALEMCDAAMSTPMPSLPTSKPCHDSRSTSRGNVENERPSNAFSLGQMLDPDSVDNIAALLRHENAHYLPGVDYLIHKNAIKGDVTEGDRIKILEWAFQVVDHFGFDREVVSIMVNYLDRMSSIAFTKTKAPLKSDEYMLVGLASLYLAMKVHGEADAQEHWAPHKLPIKSFVALCRGRYSVEAIEAMELEIITTLDWHVNPPSMLRFIATLLRFFPDSWGYERLDASIANSIFEMAKYLTEVSVHRSNFSFQFKASEIAYAAILCSFDALKFKVPFPDEARTVFEENVAAATSMTPMTKGVRLVVFMLKKLDEFPYKYEDVDIPMPTGGLSRSSSIGSEGGTTSPVCVCEPVNNIKNQKRTRLTYE